MKGMMDMCCGDEKGFNPMEMMKSCCGESEREESFNPMEMCKSMIENISRCGELAAYATPEVRGLFEDWTEEVSSEILRFVKEKGKITPEEIAKEIKISVNSVIFFISNLARQGKLKIESVITI